MKTILNCINSCRKNQNCTHAEVIGESCEIYSQNQEQSDTSAISFSKEKKPLQSLYPFESSSVYALLVTKDDLYLLTVALSGYIKVISTVNGETVRRIYAHTYGVVAIVQLNDTHIASGGSDSKIRIWNYIYGSLVLTINEYQNVWALEVLPNNLLASGGGSSNFFLNVWDSVSGIMVNEFKNHTGSVRGLKLLRNGLLASYSADKTIKLWNITSRIMLRTFNFTNTVISALVQLSSDEIICSDSGKILLWNSNTGTITKTINAHAMPILALKEINSKYLVSGSYDKSFVLWNLSDLSIIKRWTRPAVITSIELINENILTVGHSSGYLEFLDLTNYIF